MHACRVDPLANIPIRVIFKFLVQNCLRPSLPSDQTALERRIEALRSEEKRIMALLVARGAGPRGVGSGVMDAMVNLSDN